MKPSPRQIFPRPYAGFLTAKLGPAAVVERLEKRRKARTPVIPMASKTVEGGSGKAVPGTWVGNYPGLPGPTRPVLPLLFPLSPADD